MLRTLAAALLLLAPASVYAKCAPKYVLKMVVAADAPDIPADHFARKPKTFYRLGEKFGRVEELPNPASGLHLVIVASQPDLWMANLNDKTGHHAVDEEKGGLFRLPIVPMENLSDFWKNFEFGCEVPFMNALGVKPVIAADGSRTYTHIAEGITAKLTTDKNDLPQRIDLSGPNLDFAFVYQTYEQIRETPPGLFDKPAGITFVEASETPSEPVP